ncbi:BNR-4 repeat-containing protein [Mucilaginibacter sp.]|jgi:hypothetical protein|uniref:BNR-4 repeat-containing protein n=1 Tax=Mucilaginibacter sp. TaxID=1882438 RepID=UPI003563BE04
MKKKLLFRLAALALVVFLTGVRAFSQDIKLLQDSIVDNQALVYSTNAYGYYPSIQSFSQSAVTTYNNYQYVIYYNKDLRVCVGRKALPSGTWETIIFTDYLQSFADCHNIPVLGVSTDGKIHLTFDHHVSTLKYRVSSAGVANSPGSYTWSTTLFGSVVNTLPGTSASQTSVTYPAFMTTPSGKLQLVLRIGDSGGGRDDLFEYSPSTGTWSDLGFFTEKTGSYIGPITDGPTRNSYRDGIGYYGSNRLHTVFGWRETGDVQSQHDILYAYSDDEGRTWKNNSKVSFATTGTDLIKITDTAAIVYKLGQQHGLLNQEFMDVDNGGVVHVFKKHMLATEANSTSWADAGTKSKLYHHMRDTSGNWTATLLPFNTYRVNFISDANKTLYAITGDKIDIWAATAASGYTNWAMLYRYDPTAKYAEETIAIDKERMKSDNVLSIMVQEKYTTAGQPTKIHVIDFQPTADTSLILDNTSAEITGTWSTSTAVQNYYGTNYRVRASGGTGTNYVKWRATIPAAGDYSVYVWSPDGLATRATNATYVVYHSGLNTTYHVDQSLPGGKWVFLGTHAFTTLTTGNGVVMLTDQGNNQYVIADAVRFVKQNPASEEELNVSLLSFSGKKQTQDVKLNWVTSSSKNKSYFEVLRSQDGQYFQSIANIRSAGKSNHAQNYAYTDHSPFSVTNYYQLNQVDSIGTSKKSAVITVNESLASSLKAWSSEGNYVNIAVNAPVSTIAGLRVTDIYGKPILNTMLKLEKGANKVKLYAARMVPGILVATLNIENEIQSVKFMR